jgi:DNA-binding SARP family transcriptional activator
MQERGEESPLRERHLAFFAALIREAEPHLLGPDQQRWTERLEADYENLQAALSWLVHQAGKEAQSLEQAVRLANALFWFWNYTERYEVGRGWYEQLLDMPGLDRHTPAYADLTRGVATFIWLQGDYPAAQAHLQTSLETARALDYSYAIGHATLLLGIMARHQGHTERATGLIQEAEQLFQTLEIGRELAIARTNLGGVFMESGELDTARIYAEQAVSTARANDDLWGLGLSLSGLGDLVFRQGEVDSAIGLMEQALEVLQQTGQSWLAAEALLRMARMMRDQEDFKGATEQLERCFALAQDSGALQWQVAALESLGFLSLQQGHSQEAAGHFLQALQMIPGQAFKNIQLNLFAGIVQLAVHAEQWDQAATLWGAYQGLEASAGLADLPQEGPTRALLQPHIESSPFAEWVQAGNTKTWAAAARLAAEIAAGFQEQEIAIQPQFDLRLLALGPTEVYLKGRPLVPSDWTFAKPKELLFYLASSPPKTKEQIGLVFWPDASPSQLRAGLRAALYHLRRALGQREWVLYKDGFYRFNRDMDFWYDVPAFEEGIEQAEKLVKSSPEQAIEKLETTVKLYRGDFLFDIASDEWGTLRREALKHQYLSAMSTLGDLYLDGGSPDRAVEVYLALLDADELLEEAHRGLMRAYALQGERALALQQYETLVEILRDELGVPPSPETTALYEALQQNVP